MLYTDIEELEIALNASLLKALKANQRVFYAVAVPSNDHSVLYLNDTISSEEVIAESVTFHDSDSDMQADDTQQSATVITHSTSTSTSPSAKFRRIVTTVFTDIDGVYQDDMTNVQSSYDIKQNAVTYFLVATKEDAARYRREYTNYLISIYSSAVERLAKSISDEEKGNAF